MPAKAKRFCLRPGCPARVDSGYCPKHQPKRQRSKEAAEWHGLYGAEWRRYRETFLFQNPLCSDPFGEHGARLEPASVVDHRIPHRGDLALFWNPGNHQALCKRCHNRKTATEDGGFGRAVPAGEMTRG